MNKRILSCGIVATLVLPLSAADIPKETVIIPTVQFSDPKGDADKFGGNAFDRLAVELEVNKAGTNTALLTVTPPKAAALVQVVSENPNIAAASKGAVNNGQAIVTVTGVNQGLTRVKTQRISTALGVSALTPKQITMKLHVIRDSAGHTAGITTTRALEIANVAAAIWSSQANVSFGPGVSADEVLVPVDLGASADVPGPERDAISNAAASDTVAINVYFVHSLNGGADAGVAPLDESGEVFVATDAKDINRTLAHELGHVMGLKSILGCDVDYMDSDRVYQLMFGDSAPVPLNGGRTITPFQGTQVNINLNLPLARCD